MAYRSIQKAGLKVAITSAKAVIQTHLFDLEPQEGSNAYRLKKQENGGARIEGRLPHDRWRAAELFEDTFQRHSPGTLEPEERAARIYEAARPIEEAQQIARHG